MIASLDSRRSARTIARSLESMRIHGADVVATLPFMAPYVAAMNDTLDALAERIDSAPVGYEPPMNRTAAARYIGMSTSSLDDLVKHRKIKSLGDDGIDSPTGFRRKRLFDVAELNRFLGRNENAQ